ncbi:hypothetical protein MUK42_22927 [Musa troglodytarum]|uniref:BZIP domain-containing protein n=1 Tax=Musa troglodytarum TaxID=320322 RepID=A0A9E7GG81_9LILI|nr:hypothetical protein MUK42_22927 [Musa troglodytarum]
MCQFVAFASSIYCFIANEGVPLYLNSSFEMRFGFLISSCEDVDEMGVYGSDLGMESDEEIRRVPDFGLKPAGPSTSGREATSMAGPDRAQSAAQPVQRRRGRSADKEHTRLKRLLRNRVSAQQARERKKAYLNDLEAKAKDLEARNTELEERLSTLQKENNMLRQAKRASMEEIADGFNNLTVAADSQKKNRIQVSNTKKPLFFYVNLAKRYMQHHNEVELSAFGMAIATVVTMAEILKTMVLLLRRIEILLGKTEKSDELMVVAAAAAAAAAEKDGRDEHQHEDFKPSRLPLPDHCSFIHGSVAGDVTKHFTINMSQGTWVQPGCGLGYLG